MNARAYAAFIADRRHEAVLFRAHRGAGLVANAVCLAPAVVTWTLGLIAMTAEAHGRLSPASSHILAPLWAVAFAASFWWGCDRSARICRDYVTAGGA